MPEPVLKYEDYEKMNKLIEGYTNIDSALANRPLEGTKHECPCKMTTRNDLSSIKPYYNNGEFQSTVSNNNEKEIPVIIKKNRDQYLVLENKIDSSTENDIYVDSWADLPSNTNNDSQKKPTRDFITQFYFGSISIVALFVIFRMIQKSK
jgi:hypothetical protein